MSIVKWIEIKCDDCQDVASGLRFQEDIGARGLREEAKMGGWIQTNRDGSKIDLCANCKAKYEW